MTDQGRESEAPLTRALFICGAVVGICVGLAAGHVLLWSRAAMDDSANSAEWPPDLFDPQVPALTSSDTWTSPYFSGSPAPLGESLADPAATGGASIRSATEMASNVIEPDALPSSPHAEPIDEQTRTRDQLTRSIIAEEMPRASRQEQDVWFDVLRGLSVSDVKGILRIRKNVHGEDAAAPPTSPLAPFETHELALTPPRVKPNDHWGSTLSVLGRLRDVRLHNLANAGAIGVPMLEPVLSDVYSDGQGAGSRLLGLDHNISRSVIESTGRALDVAIVGPGFFQVSHNGRFRLTRSGRFTLDDQRRLSLATTSEPWRLEPPITIPVDTRSVTIQQDGRVSSTNGAAEAKQLGEIVLKTVFDTAGLNYLGEGLFETTTLSGPAERLTSGADVQQFAVERISPEALAQEREALDREQDLVDRLQAP